MCFCEIFFPDLSLLSKTLPLTVLPHSLLSYGTLGQARLFSAILGNGGCKVGDLFWKFSRLFLNSLSGQFPSSSPRSRYTRRNEHEGIPVPVPHLAHLLVNLYPLHVTIPHVTITYNKLRLSNPPTRSGGRAVGLARKMAPINCSRTRTDTNTQGETKFPRKHNGGGWMTRKTKASLPSQVGRLTRSGSDSIRGTSATIICTHVLDLRTVSGDPATLG